MDAAFQKPADHGSDGLALFVPHGAAALVDSPESQATGCLNGDSPQPGPQLFPVNAGAERLFCKNCGAPIYFALTAKGRRTPVDCAASGGVTPTATEPGRGVSHFTTCPNAVQHRRAR